METFAFTYAAEAYEDPSPAPELRELNLPNASMVGALSAVVVAGAILGAAPDAKALSYPGSTGGEVRSIQSALRSEGYDPGPVDGVFGFQTERAVRSFQASNGLTVDGVAGPATLSALGISGGGGGGGGGDTGIAYVATNGGGLNGRSGPGLGYAVIAFYPDGTTVYPTGATSGGWVELSSGAWVDGSWLEGGASGGGGGGGGGGGDYTVATNGSGLNARYGPGLGYGIGGYYPDGAGVFTTGNVSGGWVELTNGLWVDGGWLI